MVRQEIEFAGAGKHPGDPDSAALWPRDADSLSGAGLLPGNQLWPLMIPAAFAEAVEPVAHARPLAAYDYTFSYSGAIVTFTVPVTGTYDITAFGGIGSGYSA